MEKETRNAIERATQRARKILEEDFTAQLEGDFDVHRNGNIADKAGAHLSARQAYLRERIVASIEHKRAAGMSTEDAVADYIRDAAFTTLNRFAALKMLEAREFTQECISKGEQSAGYREFCGMAPGLPLLMDSFGYRLYIESLFDELSTEVKVLFDRRDPSSALWPRRLTFELLLEVMNTNELAGVWGEDETLGWIYQFFNGQDERKKMREESQAPRNSRELAIRNQFFTPRYVVQLLADNTLGRIWYEMRGANTALADRCEYMLCKTDEQVAQREKKDPRDVRVLDPACGSGHFLLYAFELFVSIYKEAHADPHSPKSEVTGRTLAEDYPTPFDLQKSLPALIIEHNLYGIDIDPRCVQVATFAMWLCAQREWNNCGIARSSRPRISRSRIILAEPVSGDDVLVQMFVARLENPVLVDLFEKTADTLQLAGDLGILLKIEKILENALAEAKEAWRQGDLFGVKDVSVDFWRSIESNFSRVLESFLAAKPGRDYERRRMFRDDSAYCLALLDTARTKFDVVLMNPPFGAGSIRAKKTFENDYSRSKNDVFAAFVERGIELLSARGLLGAITSRTGFFLSSFQKWREEVVLLGAPPTLFADLGLGVMDSALVEAAAYCLERSGAAPHGRTVFLRILEELDDKASALKTAVISPSTPGLHKRFEVDSKSFASVPGSPFAYWVSDSLRTVFKKFPAFEGQARNVRQGLATADDFRFLRLWWEIPEKNDEKWFGFAKGGKFSPFYADVYLQVNWRNDGAEIKNNLNERGGIRSNVWMLRDTAKTYFSRAGLTWPLRTKSELSVRAMPAGCVFGHKGPAAFVETDDQESLLATLAICNSMPFRALVEFQLAAADAKAGGAARSYEVGVIQRTPLATVSSEVKSHLASLAREAWELKHSMDTTVETSHAFCLPLGLGKENNGINASQIEIGLESISRKIDEAVFALYEICPEDRAAIEASSNLKSSGIDSNKVQNDEDIEDIVADDGAETPPALDAVLSWLVGVAFGRFDLRLGTGERSIPSESKPFDALRPRSAGMVPANEDGAKRFDILVNDEGHPSDLVDTIRRHADQVQVNMPDNVRAWFEKDFFPLHIRMYSQSRRKAPIYWQLATNSGRYSIWLYVHSFTKDTLFRVQNDYVAPKLAIEERRLESLLSEIREGATAALRKHLVMQETFVEELRTFLEELKRVSPLWRPNLDDGVIINFAPLWRLVPQNKQWQRELKSTWDALCGGKYDWAHLAMHLWPERVIPKCAIDRSLAIAHGVDDLFWSEGSDGKIVPRNNLDKSVEDLVRER